MSKYLLRLYRGFFVGINQQSNKNVLFSRSLSSADNNGNGVEMTVGEIQIHNVLRKSFPKATNIQVSDISGGCGAMFEVYVVSTEFEGKRKVMQHRMVTEALKEEIKDMHGLRISTEIKEDT